MMMAAMAPLVRSSLYRLHLTSRIVHACQFSTTVEMEPILDTERLHKRLTTLAPTMASSLATVGYWTNNHEKEEIVSDKEIQVMREQAIALRSEGRFQQSLSETTMSTGEIRAFPKEGVFACEPDGQDYDTAPDMLLYMSTLIGMLPPLLNTAYNSTLADNNDTLLTLTQELSLSNQAFNAKLAVTCPGGSVYPLHVDNTLGVKGSPQDDSRKLTFILYLNYPEYVNGGELRLVVGESDEVDIPPIGGRVVVFWSDEIPHQVLPCAPFHNSGETEYDRYALTVWIPETDPRNIQPPGSKFSELRELVF